MQVEAQTAAAKAAAADAAATLAPDSASGLGDLGTHSGRAAACLPRRAVHPGGHAFSLGGRDARELIVKRRGRSGCTKVPCRPDSLTERALLPGLPRACLLPLRQTSRAAPHELLLTNSSGGAAGQKIAAYRTWNTLSVVQATAGLTVNPLAAEAKRLWDEVASRNWEDPGTLSAALADYLANFGQPASEEIQALCAQLEAGLEDRESLFRRFLFGDELDARLASFGDLGAAGAVYQRAVALSISARAPGTPEGRELAGFLVERSGIANAQDAPEFAGQAFDLEEAAFSGSGDLAVQYYCKQLAARGYSIPDNLLAALGSSSRDEVIAFRDRLGKVRGYLTALDGSTQDYARGEGGSFMQRTALAAAISGGQWDDALFAVSGQTDYLGWYEGVIGAQMDAASPILLEELGQASMRLNGEISARRIEAAYWRSMAQQAAQSTSWRNYLSQTNVGSAATVGSASSTQTRDVDGYMRSAAEASENPALEAFNALAREESAFNAQLAAEAGDQGALTRFHTFLDSFAVGTALETDLPEAGELGFTAADGAYRAALSRVEGLKEDIRRFGEALSLLDLGTEERQQKLAAFKQAMDGLAVVVTGKQSAADAALEAFQASGSSYNGLYAELQGASGRLEESRFTLRVSEEIQDWAASGYLATSGETAVSYQSPVQRQTEAADKLVRATAALDALKELNGSDPVAERPVGDSATLTAYDSWKASYAELLRMNRTTGELDEAVVNQVNKTEAQYVSTAGLSEDDPGLDKGGRQPGKHMGHEHGGPGGKSGQLGKLSSTRERGALSQHVRWIRAPGADHAT